MMNSKSDFDYNFIEEIIKSMMLECVIRFNKIAPSITLIRKDICRKFNFDTKEEMYQMIGRLVCKYELNFSHNALYLTSKPDDKTVWDLLYGGEK